MSKRKLGQSFERYIYPSLQQPQSIYHYIVCTNLGGTDSFLGSIHTQ